MRDFHLETFTLKVLKGVKGEVERGYNLKPFRCVKEQSLNRTSLMAVLLEGGSIIIEHRNEGV